jgi:hypothetical protein
LKKVATPVSADAGYCLNRRVPDQIVAVNVVGDQLFLYGTDGSAYPETVQLAKQLYWLSERWRRSREPSRSIGQ